MSKNKLKKGFNIVGLVLIIGDIINTILTIYSYSNLINEMKTGDPMCNSPELRKEITALRNLLIAMVLFNIWDIYLSRFPHTKIDNFYLPLDIMNSSIAIISAISLLVLSANIKGKAGTCSKAKNHTTFLIIAAISILVQEMIRIGNIIAVLKLQKYILYT